MLKLIIGVYIGKKKLLSIQERTIDSNKRGDPLSTREADADDASDITCCFLRNSITIPLLSRELVIKVSTCLRSL